MKIKLPCLARLILGLIYFVFGLNGFLNFLHFTPPPMSEAATAFSAGMMGTGYFFPFLKGTETLCGLLLITSFAAPLALVILAPITIHIFLFHFFLTPGVQMIALPAFMVFLHIVAISGYWRLYKPLFSRGK